MPVFTDQLGRIISLNHPPKRIISLVPSQTELLSDLGLDLEVIGITKFCVHPAKWFGSKKRVGGTKSLNLPLIRQLGPELLIASKEENTKEQIAELEKYFPVWVSDIKTLPDALAMIRSVGEMTGKLKEADLLIKEIANGFSLLASELRTGARPKTAYLIWRNPYMAAGGDSFIQEMMGCCGLENIYSGQPRYPKITAEELAQKNCGLLLLSSEPFRFRGKHILELQDQLPDTRIMLVDGEMFSWYGSRLLQVPAYFRHLLREMGK